MESQGQVVIQWELGLHIRPATLIAQLLQRYNARVSLIKNGVAYNAKSVLQMLTIEAHQSDIIEIQANGNDAEEALCALKKFFLEYDDTPYW